MVVAAAAIALSGIIVVPTVTAPPAAAAVIGDDYPAYLKAANQDALTDPWKFFNRECTSFVAWRLNEVNGIPFSNFFGGQRWGNANTWGQAAAKLGYRIDKTPAVGSIAWSTVGTYGHVAWVSNVMADGRVVIEEYNWRLLSTDERGRYRTRIVAASAFTGYIHVKDLNTWPPVDGNFVRVNETGEVYRIAGGAPVHISSWLPLGGAKPTQAISAAQLDSLPNVPANGTHLRAMPSGRIFTVAFGAPIYVSSWAAVGGAKSTIDVPEATIDNAGGSAPWSHLRSVPANGFLRDPISGAVYRVADGHPYYVPSWSPYGGEQTYVNVDGASIDRCDHLNCDPWGNVDYISADSNGVAVSGWVQDPNTTSPINVEIYVDGALAKTVRADAPRSDVENLFHHGREHGFAAQVDAPVGPHTVCVYGANAGAGSNIRLGCGSVTVAESTMPSPPKPTVTGVVSVGKTLAATTIAWSPAPVTLVYQWLRSGTSIGGATFATYPVSDADAGHSLSVVVTGTKPGFASAAATSAATVAVPLASTQSSWPPAEGTLVRMNETGEVYRIAGGAPLYISSWTSLGTGAQPTRAVSAAQLGTLSTYPRNGTFVRSYPSARVFRIAHGAPIYVSSWAAVGGSAPTASISDATIAAAGGSSQWSHLRAVPADGFLRDILTAKVYRVADGHAYYVPSWSPYGSPQPVVFVDGLSIEAGCENVNCAPWGNWEAVSGGAGRIDVIGWAQDPNSLEPVDVRVRVDGVLVGVARADQVRKDVDAVYHHGVQRGFDSRFAVAQGTHQVCLDAANVGAGTKDYAFGCRSVSVAAPVPAAAIPFTSAPQPTVSGTATVGQTLSASVKGWVPSTGTFSYQWARAGSAIAGATGISYALVPEDAGKLLTVTVVGAAAGYTSATRTSVATLAVAVDPAPAHLATIFTNTNAARVTNALAPLKRNAAMDAVAGAWARSMASSGTMSHNPAYSSQIPAGWTLASENVATGYSSATVVSGWLNSSGHRTNIMSAATDIGIGYFVDARGVAWSVQNFARYAQ